MTCRMTEMEKPLTPDGAAQVLGWSRRWLQGWLSKNPYLSVVR